MEAVGLISISKGRNAQAPQFDEGAAPAYHPSLASRFRPTQVMVSMAEQAGAHRGSARKHFPQQLPNNVIEVRGKSTTVRGMKTKGKKLKLAHTEKSRAMEADVKSLNRFLADFELEGGSFSGYRRLFSNGDIAGFDFQWGGRLYGAGDYSYQNIKKTERQQMTIGGEEVVEIDINASYLTILHGISDYPLPNRYDLYAIGGYDRTIVKAWITATIGLHGFHTRWPKNAIREIKDAGINKPNGLTMTSLQPVILDHFPMLAEWPS
jgi:opacity protein-like surface antigen